MPSSTPASLMSLKRPLAGGEDQKPIHDFELYYMQPKAIKDDIVEAGDGRATKEYFGWLGTCSVSGWFPISNIFFDRPLCLSS